MEANAAPSSAITRRVSTTPRNGARRPRGVHTSTSSVPCTSRTTTSRSTRPSSRAVRLAGVTRWLSLAAGRGAGLALDDAGPVLGDQAEADEERPEDAELHQDPGHEDLVGVPRPELARDRLQQGTEQHDVEDRLHHHDH